MPAAQGKPPFDTLARQWHHLADRRLAHFTELYRSGRWRLYYRTEAQFAERMMDVIRTARVWAELAGRAPPAVTVPVPTSTPAPAIQESPPQLPSPAQLPSRAELATAPKTGRLRPAA